MSSQVSELAIQLARNLLELRQSRNLTQNALAKLVGLPRSTIANIESGQGNPSLSTLSQISMALHTTIDQLLDSKKVICHLLPASEVPCQERLQGQAKIFKLFPGSSSSMNIERIEIQPGYTMKGSPHLSGTKEYFHCVQGEMTIKVSGIEYHVRKGDTLIFPGQMPHAYSNSGKVLGIGFSVIVLAPLSV